MINNIYGHFNRFTVDFTKKYIEIKNKMPELPQTKKYNQLYEILKQLEPINIQDKIELDYILAKFAFILYDVEYFQNKKNFESFKETKEKINIGEIIWYLTFIIYSGNNDEINELHKCIQENLISYGDQLQQIEFLYPHFSILMNQHKFDQVYEEFLLNRLKIQNLNEEFVFTKSIIYSLIIQILPYIEKKDQKDSIISEINGIIDKEKDPLTYCYVTRHILRMDFLNPSKTERNRKKLIQIQNTYSEIGTDLMQMKINEDLGILEYYNGNYFSSVSYHRKAIEIAEKLNNLSDHAYISFLLAASLDESGNYQEAERFYLSALKDNREQNNEIQMINIFDSLGYLYVETGSFHKAEENYNLSLKFAEKYQVNSLIAGSNLNLANLKLLQGKLSKVSELLAISKRFVEDTIEDNHSLSIISAQAKLAYMRGNYNEALSVINEGKIKLKQSFPVDQIANFYFHEAEVRLGIGQVSNAKSAIRSIYKKKDRMESLKTFCSINQILGRIYCIENSPLKAKQILEEAYHKLLTKGSFGHHFQSIIIDLIELSVIEKNSEEYVFWMDILYNQLNSHNIEILDIIKVKLDFLRYLKSFSENELDIRDLEDFEVFLEGKYLLNLKYKVNLLKIRYLVDHNSTDDALEILKQLEEMVNLNPNLIFQIEIQFIQGLILSRDFDFDKAIEKMSSLTNLLQTYNLKKYIDRQQEIISLINKHRDLFTEIYDFSEKTDTQNKQKENLKVPLNVIHQYLDESIKILS
ncbi:tetratricopeptide repeat protein [Candidatus Lokiarchaeum ossiferum]|uniref:tetratricopeptide repeat protein n=1 Tax=Candidatus Lokiarchaeum ossiferum TaxID=2951803 RepID=UPI00352E14DC